MSFLLYWYDTIGQITVNHQKIYMHIKKRKRIIQIYLLNVLKLTIWHGIIYLKNWRCSFCCYLKKQLDKGGGEVLTHLRKPGTLALSLDWEGRLLGIKSFLYDEFHEVLRFFG